MTEQEAKKKWCPIHQQLPNYKEDQLSSFVGAGCLASGCMAWTWFVLLGDDEDPKEGYCGLITK